MSVAEDTVTLVQNPDVFSPFSPLGCSALSGFDFSVSERAQPSLHPKETFDAHKSGGIQTVGGFAVYVMAN